MRYTEQQRAALLLVAFTAQEGDYLADILRRGGIDDASMDGLHTWFMQLRRDLNAQGKLVVNPRDWKPIADYMLALEAGDGA